MAILIFFLSAITLLLEVMQGYGGLYFWSLVFAFFLLGKLMDYPNSKK